MLFPLIGQGMTAGQCPCSKLSANLGRTRRQGNIPLYRARHSSIVVHFCPIFERTAPHAPLPYVPGFVVYRRSRAFVVIKAETESQSRGHVFRGISVLFGLIWVVRIVCAKI